MRNVVMALCLVLGGSALSAQDALAEAAALEAAPEPSPPAARATEPARDATSLEAARLVHFESRFGIAARELDAWAAMQGAAREALAELRDRDHGVSPAQVWARSFLEFASDDLVAAERTLFGDAPRERARDCPYYAEESYAWLTAARAVMTELLELPGEDVLPYGGWR